MTQIIEVLEDYRETLLENSGTSASAGYAVETAIEETRALLAEVEALRAQRDALVKAANELLSVCESAEGNSQFIAALAWKMGEMRKVLPDMKDGTDDTH